MTVVLYVGNKNYSSWSMRPWLVLSWAGIAFETVVVPLGGAGYGERRMADVLAITPSGTVPALRLGNASDDVIGDSLAIAEWAAEQVPALWPADALARSLARSATCEMHAGFSNLRAKLPCNIRRRAEPRTLDDAIRREVARVEQIWTSLRARFGAGGGYLFGAAPTIVDAFFTPVATRFRTYGVPLAPEAAAYASTLLADPAFLRWEAAALTEPMAMPAWDAV